MRSSAFILILQPLVSIAALTQELGSPASYCDNSVMFNCVNEHQSFMTWDVLNGNSRIYSVTVISSSGQQRREVLPLIITVDIKYSNRSALVSTLIITGVTPQLVTNVVCNDLSKAVLINFNSTLFPSYLVLLSDFQCLELSVFNMTWENVTQEDSTSYLVNISPSGSNTRDVLGNVPSVQSISLRNNLLYNFTLSLEACPDIFNATYMLGGCLALMNCPYFSVVQFNVFLSGEVTGKIKCNNNDSETYILVCTENDEWNYSITDVCISNSHNDSESYSNNSDMEIISTFHATEQINQDCNTATLISIPVFTTSVIGSNLLMLFIGVLSGLLIGLKLRLKISLHQTTTPSGEEGIHSSVNTPLYEEIKLANVSQHVKMSQNDAYSVSRN